MPDPAIFIAKSSMMKLYKIYEILRACTLVAPRVSLRVSRASSLKESVLLLKFPKILKWGNRKNYPPIFLKSSPILDLLNKRKSEIRDRKRPGFQRGGTHGARFTKDPVKFNNRSLIIEVGGEDPSPPSSALSLTAVQLGTQM